MLKRFIAFTEFKQPRGLYVLSFSELCERFSFYGLQNILVLYLTKFFLFSDDGTYTLFGAYSAFAYALPVLGGNLADRWFGYRNSIIFGSILLIISYILLAIPNFNFFIIGLAINVCGIGFYKPNTTALVGKLYATSDRRSSGGYTLFYTSMNIGATLGAIIYGLATQLFGWSYEYLISAIIIGLALIIFIKNLNYFPESSAASFKLKSLSNSKIKNLIKNCCYLLLIGLLIFLVTLLFFYPAIMSDFLLIFATLVITTLIINAFKYQKIERNHIFALIILAFFGMCFFAASMQVGSSINLFIQRNINHKIFQWEIPAIMFTSLYPLAVVIMAPFITLLWGYLATRRREPSVPIKLFIGLLLASFSFICFMLAGIASKANFNSYIPLFWIVIGNLLIGTGELILTPAIFSAISRLAPKQLQGTFMGTWFLFVAFGGYLSGALAKISNQIKLDITIYIHSFGKIALLIFGIALVQLFLTPFLKKLTTPTTEPYAIEGNPNSQL